MVLGKGAPFKATLLNSSYEQDSTLTIPIALEARLPVETLCSEQTVVQQKKNGSGGHASVEHFFEIEIPQATEVAGVDITSAVLSVSVVRGGKETSVEDEHVATDVPRCTIHAQMLDGKSRPASIPFAVGANFTKAQTVPVSSSSSSSPDNQPTGPQLSVPMLLPLCNSQRIRFILVQEPLRIPAHTSKSTSTSSSAPAQPCTSEELAGLLRTNASDALLAVTRVQFVCRMTQMYGKPQLSSAKAIAEVHANLERMFVMAPYDVNNPRLVPAQSLPLPVRELRSVAAKSKGSPANVKETTKKKGGNGGAAATAGKLAGTKRNRTAQEHMDDGTDELPPLLHYAFVPGGPDES